MKNALDPREFLKLTWSPALQPVENRPNDPLEVQVGQEVTIHLANA